MNCNHLSHFAGSYLAVSQIRRFLPRLKILHADPSMNKSIKIVRKHELVFQPYHMTFKEMKEKTSFHYNVSVKKIKTLKILKYCFWGVVKFSRIFAFRGGGGVSWNLTPQEKRGMSERYFSVSPLLGWRLYE